MDPCQCVIKKGGGSPLFCPAPHFFVVEHAVDSKVFLTFPGKKAFQGGKGTLQVVQAAAGQEFSGSSPDSAFLPVVQEKVMPQDLFLRDSCRICDQFHKSTLCRQVTINGEHIFLDIVFAAVIDLTVHVNRQIRDHDKVAADIDEDGAEAPLRLILYDHSSGDREGTVKPGCTDHAAVTLDVQPDVMSFGFQFGIFFDLKGGGVAVAGDDMHTLHLLNRNGKGNER